MSYISESSMKSLVLLFNPRRIVEGQEIIAWSKNGCPDLKPYWARLMVWAESRQWARATIIGGGSKAASVGLSGNSPIIGRRPSHLSCVMAFNVSVKISRPAIVPGSLSEAQTLVVALMAWEKRSWAPVSNQ